MDYVEVQNAQVPAIGLGTWQLRGMACRQAVEQALSIGYRHIDTAEIYGNEADVGAALRQSDVARDEVWLTTKLFGAHLTRKELGHAVHDSLRRLGTDWVDLLMIHWPNPEVPMLETLDAMQRAQDEGSVRYIGVSNFPPRMLGEALTLAPVFSIQVEYHPYLDQRELLTIAQRGDLLFTAYSPLARGRVMQDEKIREIAQAYGKSPSQVVLRWLIQQHNVAAIPKASSHAHLKSNFDVFDFTLSAEDARRVESFDAQLRLIDPDFGPDWSQ